MAVLSIISPDISFTKDQNRSNSALSYKVVLLRHIFTLLNLLFGSFWGLFFVRAKKNMECSSLPKLSVYSNVHEFVMICQRGEKSAIIQIFRAPCLSAGLSPRRGAALSGISPQCFSRGSCGPESCKTPTRASRGSAGSTTLWWRTHCSYSWPALYFCEWRRGHKEALSRFCTIMSDVTVSWLPCGLFPVCAFCIVAPTQCLPPCNPPACARVTF